MKPPLRESIWHANTPFTMIPRQSVGFTTSHSEADAQKTTEWPFVSAVYGRFCAFSPGPRAGPGHRSPFAVRRSLVRGSEFEVRGSEGRAFTLRWCFDRSRARRRARTRKWFGVRGSEFGVWILNSVFYLPPSEFSLPNQLNS